MSQEHEIVEEAERLQRLGASPDGFDPVLRDQIETSLHAGYAWNAKYAKYGILWVWFFWVLKWGFVAASLLATVGGIVLLIQGPGESANWLLWLGSTLPLAVGAFCFGAFHIAMKRAHEAELKLADRYSVAR